eukprot:CAMPEP_0115839308 /NCGR_PEP_ID=MMETSP0287-20121206/6186_1 /TAXON_ID=412157 /ORGANISM="Chrysochromulina rotalis, Strain UIO044" /LENGTH=395 /DNA_ID=CAMNT_0003292879 /DNA_START=57 /DNA_END=1244 /DNA_ORIENTATION=+
MKTRSRRQQGTEVIEDLPKRAPTRKEAGDSGATVEQAAHMPWHPTHSTICADHPCRPGEGNLKGYKMWGQPYIHREAWVQSRLRHWPHTPDPQHYTSLVKQARHVASESVLAAADYDFREIILNWAVHAERVGLTNTLVLSMDTEIHDFLEQRKVVSVDNSANLLAWNVTCLTRHIQRVRMERQLAVAALVAAGLDVLLTDATVVFVRNPLPWLAHPKLAGVDVFAQRESGPAAAARKIGCGVNPGFLLVRSGQRSSSLARLFHDIVRRGLVEFYNRWNNVVDALGWSFIIADTADLRSVTSALTNETTFTTLARYDGVRVALLPHDRFPRIGSWVDHRHQAFIHHLVADGTLGKWYEEPWGVLPFRGHRQRLDRYDQLDFDAHRRVMQQVGLWL